MIPFMIWEVVDIYFQTLDDEPVRLLFMIAAAYNQHAYYLKALSFFSARLKSQELRSALLSAKTPQDQDAYTILRESGS
jgi:PTS system nitrogen regulatory IIA component